LTGALAGVIVVVATSLIEKFVDDPVGAIAVHGVCGAWGTLAAGLFDSAGFSLSTVGVQALGIGAAFLWTFPLSYLVFSIVKRTMGIRVDEELELEGLDISEHAAKAYPEFVPTGNGHAGVLVGEL
jgi:Amt family ammonium transporter